MIFREVHCLEADWSLLESTGLPIPDWARQAYDTIQKGWADPFLRPHLNAYIRGTLFCPTVALRAAKLRAGEITDGSTTPLNDFYIPLPKCLPVQGEPLIQASLIRQIQEEQEALAYIQEEQRVAAMLADGAQAEAADEAADAVEAEAAEADAEEVPVAEARLE